MLCMESSRLALPATVSLPALPAPVTPPLRTSGISAAATARQAAADTSHLR